MKKITAKKTLKIAKIMKKKLKKERCLKCGKKGILKYFISCWHPQNPSLKVGLGVCQSCYRKTPKGRRLRIEK